MSNPLAIVDVEAPAGAPLLNANHRRHYRVKARMVRAWRRAAKTAALELGPLPTPVHVTVLVHRRSRAGRWDAGNYAPTAKAVLDGIVDAGVIPDDNNAHVVGPDLRPGEPWADGGVTVILEPHHVTNTRAERLFAPPVKDPLWTT